VLTAVLVISLANLALQLVAVWRAVTIAPGPAGSRCVERV
jgi:hypothetical protein